MKRPGGVTLVAVLVAISGAFNLIFGIIMVLAPFIDTPDLTDIDGTPMGVPTFYLLINGLLSVVLGLMYFWLSKMTLIGSSTAYVLINFLAGINIFFGLFRLPYGWGIIVLSIIVLIIVNTQRARAWFTQTV